MLWDITYHHILREAAKYPWVVQIDTGSSTIGEVAEAVEVLEQAGTSKSSSITAPVAILPI